MRKTPRAEPKDLCLAKLAESGLDATDLHALHLEPIAGASAPTRLGPHVKPLDGLLIPYYGLDGKPRKDKFWRYRYLQPDPSFAGQVAKPQRYTQTAAPIVAAYFPPSMDWARTAQDPGAPIIITEGELKAASAVKFGYSCIGLGGVYNWQSARHGVPFLPELEAIDWVGREVYIAFDSDLRTNPLVKAALQALSDQLVARGAAVFTLELPSSKDNLKVGLDDFLVARGDKGLDELIGLAQPWLVGKVLWALNDEVIYVRDPGIIVELATGQKLSVQAFTQHAYANRKMRRLVTRASGAVAFEDVKLADAWVQWPGRREAKRLVYRPGTEGLMTDDQCVNLWPGWGCQPKKGDVRPFLQLIDHLFLPQEAAAKRWFLQWLAYPLQYPGTKLFSSCYVWGVDHGTGKSLVGVSVGRIYGKNYKAINQEDLMSTYNGWAENRQFIMIDDITGVHKQDKTDVIKTMITREEYQVKIKYVPEFFMPDLVNYYITSNHPDALKISKKDRRTFVHEIKREPLDEAFYVDYMMWLDSSTGASALFDYLLHVDTGDFNPSAPAYKTKDRDLLVEASLSDVGMWAETLAADPDAVLRLGTVPIQRDLMSNAELRQLADPDNKQRLTAAYLGRELKNAGLRQVCDGAVIPCQYRPRDRYYVVRHPERWANATVAEATKYLNEVLAPPKPGKKKY